MNRLRPLTGMIYTQGRMEPGRLPAEYTVLVPVRVEAGAHVSECLAERIDSGCWLAPEWFASGAGADFTKQSKLAGERRVIVRGATLGMRVGEGREERW